MTIPPASERAVRPCEECVFMDFEYISCRLFDGITENPCDYNFSQKEMQYLIECHNQQEQI